MPLRARCTRRAGITVGRVTYLGSQPWPMPRSLMLGFHALAEGGQRIQVDADEIGEAHWYSRDELLAALTGRQARPAAADLDRAPDHRGLVRRRIAGRRHLRIAGFLIKQTYLVG